MALQNNFFQKYEFSIISINTINSLPDSDKKEEHLMNLMWLQLETNIHILSKERVASCYRTWLVFHKSAVANGGRQNEHSWAPAFEFGCLEKRVCQALTPSYPSEITDNGLRNFVQSFPPYCKHRDLAHPVLARLASLLVQAISTMAQQSNSQQCKYDHCPRQQ